MRNVAAKSEVQSILSSKIVFIAAEKRSVRRTRQSGFISARRGNVRYQTLVKIGGGGGYLTHVWV